MVCVPPRSASRGDMSPGGSAPDPPKTGCLRPPDPLVGPSALRRKGMATQGLWIKGMATQGLWDSGYGHTGAVGLRVWPHRGGWIKGMATQGLVD